MKLQLICVLTIAYFSLASHCSEDIWPFEELFEPPTPATGWANAANERLDEESNHERVGSAHPIALSTLTADQDQPAIVYFGFSMLGDEYLPTEACEAERVTMYMHESDVDEWTPLDQAVTLSSEHTFESYRLAGVALLDVPAERLPPAGQARSIVHLLEPVNFYARAVLYHFAPGAQAVVFELDGTLLSLNSFSVCLSVKDICETRIRNDAERLARTWAQKGYDIIYVSERSPAAYHETYEWLVETDFPPGLVRLADSTIDARAPVPFKRRVLASMRAAGIDIVAIYGDAKTDIVAYADAGVPKDRTFIIGPHGGEQGTVDLGASDDDDAFARHISSYVEQQPDAASQRIVYNGDTGPIEDGSAASLLSASFLFLLSIVALIH
jgi:hypothetical protein